MMESWDIICKNRSKVDTEKVLDILKANGGSLNFTYKIEAKILKMFCYEKKHLKPL